MITKKVSLITFCLALSSTPTTCSDRTSQLVFFGAVGLGFGIAFGYANLLETVTKQQQAITRLQAQQVAYQASLPTTESMLDAPADALNVQQVEVLMAHIGNVRTDIGALRETMHTNHEQLTALYAHLIQVAYAADPRTPPDYQENADSDVAGILAEIQSAQTRNNRNFNFRELASRLFGRRWRHS